MERKLAAIFSADVKGYSRLMGDDEEETVRTLTVYREALVTLIERHRGRVVDSPGDNLLADFPSVVDAVQSAVAIQRELAHRNAALPPHRQMHFRIGINLGDILVDGDHIYGDGVNIAARMEELAEAGGLCVSGTAYDQVYNKLHLPYVSLGPHTVKNIADPVRVYQVELESEVLSAGISGAPQARHRRWRTAVLAAIGILLVSAGGAAIWGVYQRPSPPPAEVASEVMPALSLPDKPSIAVLPFINMSGDSEQDYFSDGITEDLLTALSKSTDLFVIAHHSVLTYKGKTVPVQQVGRELGVRYVLEGSVRKAGDRVRITAQLVEAATGHHLWAERYDRPLIDLFSIQDEVVQRISGALLPHVFAAEHAATFRKPPDSLQAYDHFQRGSAYLHASTREGMGQAYDHFEQAIDLDPNYAEAYAGLAWNYAVDRYFALTGRAGPEAYDTALALYQKALALNPNLALAYMGMSWTLYRMGRFEEALAAGRKAAQLNPNDADNHLFLAHAEAANRLYEDAIASAETAMRLNPRWPIWYLSVYASTLLRAGRYDQVIDVAKSCLARAPTYLVCSTHYGGALYATHQYAKAIEVLETCLGHNPKFVPCRIWLAGTLSRFQQATSAQEQVATIRQLWPHYFLQIAPKSDPFPLKDTALETQLLDDLRQAGLK